MQSELVSANVCIPLTELWNLQDLNIKGFISRTWVCVLISCWRIEDLEEHAIVVICPVLQLKNLVQVVEGWDEDVVDTTMGKDVLKQYDHPTQQHRLLR